MRRAVLATGVTLALALVSDPAHAHGGEPHVSPVTTAATASGVVRRTVSSTTETFEVVAKHPAIDGREPLPIDVFVTDFATNAPVAGARVHLSVPDLKLEADATEAGELPGLYEITATPGAEGTFSGVLSVTTPTTADLLVFDALQFGPDERARGATWPRFVPLAAVGLASVALGLFALVRQRRRRRMHRSAASAALVSALFLGAASLATAHGGEAHGSPAAPGAPPTAALVSKEAQIRFGILTTRVRRTEIPGRRALPGTVMARPEGKAELIAPRAGRVSPAEGHVPRVGDVVRAGQPLLVIEGRLSNEDLVTTASELPTAEAGLVAAEQELGLANAELERLRSLERLTSRKELETAEARQRTARASADAGRRSVQVLRDALHGAGRSATRQVLASPIAGVVSEAHATAGHDVEEGEELLVVLDTSRVLVRVDVPESDWASMKLTAGARAEVVSRAAPQQPVPATFTSSAPSIDPASRTVAAFFAADNPEGVLLENMLVDVLAETGQPAMGFVVPSAAIVELAGKDVVLVHSGPEEFAPRDVRLGVAGSETTEILEGLQDGDRVVVAGAYQVRTALLAGAGR